MSKRIDWSEDMVSYLLSHKEDTLEVLSQALGVSTTTCRTKLLEFGIAKGHKGAEIPWRKDQLDYLVEHFPYEAGVDIAEAIGLSSRAVSKKASELGLKKSPDYDYRKYLKRYVKNYSHGNYVPYIKSKAV